MFQITAHAEDTVADDLMCCTEWESTPQGYTPEIEKILQKYSMK